jgi:hypothetical protein
LKFECEIIFLTGFDFVESFLFIQTIIEAAHFFGNSELESTWQNFNAIAIFHENFLDQFGFV